MVQNRGVKEATTVSDLENYQASAERRAAQGVTKIIKDIDESDSDDITVRPALPKEDLNENEEPSDTAVDASNNTYDVDGPASAGEAGFYELSSSDKLDDKSAVLWGFQIPEDAYDGSDTGVPVDTVTVVDNNGAELAQYDVQSIVNSDTLALVIEDPVIVTKQSVRTRINITEDDAEFTFKPLITIGEEGGETFSDSGPFVSNFRP